MLRHLTLARPLAALAVLPRAGRWDLAVARLYPGGGSSCYSAGLAGRVRKFRGLLAGCDVLGFDLAAIERVLDHQGAAILDPAARRLDVKQVLRRHDGPGSLQAATRAFLGGDTLVGRSALLDALQAVLVLDAAARAHGLPQAVDDLAG